jgi:hypothetical protein
MEFPVINKIYKIHNDVLTYHISKQLYFVNTYSLTGIMPTAGIEMRIQLPVSWT